MIQNHIGILAGCNKLSTVMKLEIKKIREEEYNGA